MLSGKCPHFLWCINENEMRCHLLWKADLLTVGVDRLSAPILSILPISAIFKTDLPIYIFFYANKHTIYRLHYLLVNKLYRWNYLMFKCAIWLDAACLSSTLCGLEQSPPTWYVGSHESDQSTWKTGGSLTPKALANWSRLRQWSRISCLSNVRQQQTLLKLQ